MTKRRVFLQAALLLPSAALAQAPSTPASRLAAGKSALNAANAGRWAEAESYAAAADPLVAKLVQWIRLTQRNAPATTAEQVAFLRNNPDWPMADTIARRAEVGFGGAGDDALALAHFATFPPRSLAAALRYAEALSRAGRGQDVAAVLRRAWLDAPGDAAAETRILEQFGRVLTADDHAQRFDRLYFARDLPAAHRALERLTGARLNAGRIRLALAGESGAAYMAQRPLDLGWAYEKARVLRRRDQDADAVASWNIAEPFQVDLDPEIARAIWAERQILARKLLRLNNPRDAHRIAAHHGQPMGSEGRIEAEFLAGFIALRFLNDPALAQRHFAALAQGSRSVITRARAFYWEGRALAARGQNGAARERYAAAAQLPTAFYGQLASLTMGESQAALDARLSALQTPAIDPARAQQFAQRELARVVTTLAALGDTRRTRAFLLRLQALAPDPQDRLLTARLANHIGRPDNAVWVARRAAIEGDVLLPEGWPTPFRPPVTSPEPAFIYSITRQESNFDTEAVSSANARGLMQLLPSTAQLVARRIGMNYRVEMLTGDPQANIKLGAAYLDEMLGRFEGSLVLAAAAYNAGPRRVDEWLGTYGDPRRGERDWLDWMEMIPFTETRNYAQRIVEGAVIYRARQTPPMTAPHPMAGWLASAR